MATYLARLNPDVPIAGDRLQEALASAPTDEPLPIWVQALYELANGLAPGAAERLDEGDVRAIRAWSDGVDDWIDEEGRELVLLERLREA